MSISKVGIITYQVPHLKTEQILNQFLWNPSLTTSAGGGQFDDLCLTLCAKGGARRAVFS